MAEEKDNSKMSGPTRRDFLKTSAVAAASFMIVPRFVLGGKGYIAPSDRLIIASVGVGGKGADDIGHFDKTGKAEMAFLCDVDDKRAADTVKKFPKATYYKDWRKMFDKEYKNFDAVSVSTPDHTHAIVAYHAMRMASTFTCKSP